MTRCLLAGLVALTALSTSRAAEPDVKIGMYQSMFRDVSPELVAVIAKPLKGILEKTVGLSGDAELFSDSDLLAAKLNDNKVQVGVFHGYEFAWAKAKYPNLEPLMIAIPQTGKLQAVIVVNSTNTAAKLNDLKAQTVVVPRGSKAHLLLFLDEQRKGFAADVAATSPKKAMTIEAALTGVADGTVDAVIVDAGSLAAYRKNSPGNASVLKVIGESEVFPYAVLAVNKTGLSQQNRGKLIDGLTNAHMNAQGQPLLMLWGLKAFDSVPADYDAQLAAISKSYPAPKVVGTLTAFDKDKSKEKKKESDMDN